MFGFSLPKLLILIALIAVVWYGFKAAGRVNRRRQAQADQADQAEQAPRKKRFGFRAKDMVQCPKCKAYTASLDSHSCEV